MTDGTVRRLVWGAFALVFVLYGISIAFAALVDRWDPFSLFVLVFPLIGILVLARQRRNRVGWILLAIGFLGGLPLNGYAQYGLVTDPGSLPGADAAAALSGPLWAPAIGLMGTYLLLLFPDGRLPSPRWRIVGWLAGTGIVATYVALLVGPGGMGDQGFPGVRNPFGIEALRPYVSFLLFPIALIPVSILASAASVVVRFRRSRGVERLQLKWLTAAAGVVAFLYALAMASAWAGSQVGSRDPTWLLVLQNVAVLSFLLIPIAIGFAMLKHGLFDVVIGRTVVFATMAAFITLVYVAIVVGIGTLIGDAGRPNLALSIVATAVVAVTFQPVRERLQRLSNRLVYGKRATPYEILSDFASRMGDAYAAEDLLPRMARILGEGTGAQEAQVWLKVGQELRLDAVWPGEPQPSRLPVRDGQILPIDADRVLPVDYRGELLGALSVTKPPGERLTSGEEKLAADLASQAGLVLHNVRLTEELRERLRELQASRQRIVTAQDAERRRLERNIHDGAQQQLVALAIKARLARSLVERDPNKATDLLAQVEADASTALGELRDLARGIYPPLLADKGLLAALEAQARKAPLPIEVEGDGIRRYPQEYEAAVYFCTLEALQNVAKYAAASRAVVRLAEEGGDLRFTVEDHGGGFDTAQTGYGTGLQGMADRLAALGGELTVESTPGRGTTVSGRLPLGLASR